jgi:hypothetical protein
MTGFSHMLFVDESGIGSPAGDITSVWASVAVAVHLDSLGHVDNEVKRILSENFHPKWKELKGTNFPHELKPGRETKATLQDISNLIKNTNSDVWVSVTHYGVDPPNGFQGMAALAPKQIARQLLFERVSGYLHKDSGTDHRWFVVWDLGEVQELNSFSKSLCTFTDGFSHKPMSTRLCPSTLGGLSHDWGGLQLADVIAHYAYHKYGAKQGLAGANGEKSAHFSTFFWPILKKDSHGGTVGWKAWSRQTRMSEKLGSQEA